MSWVEKFFELKERKSTVLQEFRGASSTFLTMVYILFANASILSLAGLPVAPTIATTALTAGIASILMGVIGNFPIALASGMGLNALVATTLTSSTGSWQTAMGLVFWDGIIVLILVLTGFREAVLRAIPRDLKIAISGGIGFFIAFIGLVNAKIVIVPKGTLAVLGSNANAVMPPVTFGGVTSPEALVAISGIVVTSYLLARRFNGAIVLGVVVSSVISFFMGVSQLPSQWSLPSFETAFQADLVGALNVTYLPLLFSLILVDFFDTIGTVTAISDQAGLLDREGRVPRLRHILAVDSISASIGGILSASSATAYIESAAGVAEGARTGLHSFFVGVFFLLAIFLGPLGSLIPAAATAPALILAGFLMCGQLRNIEFSSFETSIPAFITLITIPLTYSISHGIGYGFISYVTIKTFSGKPSEVRPLMYLVSAAFLAYFLIP